MLAGLSIRLGARLARTGATWTGPLSGGRRALLMPNGVREFVRARSESGGATGLTPFQGVIGADQGRVKSFRLLLRLCFTTEPVGKVVLLVLER